MNRYFRDATCACTINTKWQLFYLVFKPMWLLLVVVWESRRMDIFAICHKCCHC